MTESRGLILNVDDYEASRHARTELLRRAGFQVLEAGTGAEALRVAGEKRLDLAGVPPGRRSARSWRASRVPARR